jgi:hypothetical protein
MLKVKKSLRTKVVLAIALTVIVFWGISGVLTLKHAASFFAELESHIQEREGQQKLLSELREDKHSLFRELAVIRFLTGAAGGLVLCIAVGLIWRRRVSRPMTLISERIHEMRLGTWSHPIPVDQGDEMGTLMREFNDLGPELTFTAHQYAAASKLAGMALIGQRVVRRTMSARQQLVAASVALARLPVDDRSQGMAIEQFRLVADELESIAADFDSEFQAELARVGPRRE